MRPCNVICRPSTRRHAGGTVLCGGKTGPPGISSGFTTTRRPVTVQTETFAPILYLIEYQSLDDLHAMHNALASRPVIDDFHRQPAARRKIPCRHSGSDCGIANVNIGTSGAEN